MPFYLGWGVPQYIIILAIWALVSAFCLVKFKLKKKLVSHLILLFFVIINVGALRIGDKQETLNREQFNSEINSAAIEKVQVHRYLTKDAQKDFSEALQQVNKDNKQ